MRRLFSTFLYASILLGSAAQWVIASPDFGFYAATEDCGFYKTEPEGTQRYGYTLYPSADGRNPDYRYWCKPVAQGKTKIWYDRNEDKVKDADELRDCEWYIWYTLEIRPQCASYADSMIRPDGVIPPELETMRKRYADNGLASVGIGDAAGAANGTCEFVRGPYSVAITVRPQMQVETSKYVVQDKTYIPNGFQDAGTIAEACNKAYRERTDEATRLAKEMCARWEQSYKYATALPRDVRQFIPRKPDVPKDLSVDISSPSKDEPSTWAMVYYKQPDGQFYGLEIGASCVGVSQSYNQALAQAHERFSKESGNLKKAASITIPGADEAVRALYRNTGSNCETIIFRAKNIYVRVWGSVRAKSLANTRAAVIAKLVCAKITGGAAPATDATEPGEQSVELLATPASVWADGKSKVKLTVTAKTADGKPISGASFGIDLESNLLGNCEDVKMITDASGKATATYLPAEPGDNTVTVKGEAGTASTKISQGGLIIAPDNPGKTSVLADGKSRSDLTVTCVSPSGQPVSGAKISCAIESKDTTAKGTLESATAVTGADGKAKLSYTAPELDPASGVRAADVYVTASASVGNPARTVKATERISLYAGECVYLKIEKPGFETLPKHAASVRGRNGRIAGTVTAQEDGTPVNCAKITVSDQAKKQLAEVVTGTDGKFDIKFIGDPTSSSDSKNELPKPIEFVVNADLTNRAKECREDLSELRSAGYDVSSITNLTNELTPRLAKSVPATGQSPNKLATTDYLINAYPRLAWACRYAKLLNRRQCESAAWLSENVKAGLGDTMDVFGVTDKLHDAAKSKLKDRFAGAEWEKYTDSVLTDFVNIMYDQFQKGVDMAKTMNYDTGDVENYKKFGLEWASKKTVEGVAEGVKLTLERLSHKQTQEMLTKAGGAATRGEMSSNDYTPDSNTALNLFTTFEEAHNKQNISNCNTEQYRLGVKLFIDTFVKGPMIYLNVKKLAMDPELLQKIADLDTKSLEELQDTFIKSGDLASKMGSAVDSMFQGYQGYNWIVDYCRANTARAELINTLVK